MKDGTAERIASALGIEGTTGGTLLTPGHGDNDLWRLHRDGGDLVIRLFPTGTAREVAEREARLHDHVRRHGVAAPEIIGCAVIGGRPALAMAWVEGQRVAEALWSGGAPPAGLGRACGETLAALHAIGTPPSPDAATRPWIPWAGDRTAELSALLGGYGAGSLLHLDFHPENLILGADGTVTVLDWANARMGPPQADVARTLTILDLVRDAYPNLTDAMRSVLQSFREGFLAGYERAGGDPIVDDAMLAWAYAVQEHDLIGGWVPEWYFARLRRLYRRLMDRISAEYGAWPDARPDPQQRQNIP